MTCKADFRNTKTKLIIFPTAYDPDDFLLRPNPPKDKLTLTHCGTMCSRFSVLAFFEALKKAVNQKSELKNKIEFVQIGNVDEDIFHSLENDYRQHLNIKFSGYLEHKSAIEKTLQSSAVVVFSGITPTLDLNLPGKLYEALASDLPLFAVFKKTSPAREILNGIQGVYLLDPDDIESCVEILRHFFEQYLESKIEPVERRELLIKYSRKYQAEQIASLLEKD